MPNQDNPSDKPGSKEKKQERISASKNRQEEKDKSVDQNDYIDTESEFSVIESLREKR